MKCKYCGKEFEKTSNSQKYCSVECRNNDMGYVYRMRKKENKKAKKTKANVTKNPYAWILELDKEGKKVGLSYGKYVAANRL